MTAPHPTSRLRRAENSSTAYAWCIALGIFLGAAPWLAHWSPLW